MSTRRDDQQSFGFMNESVERRDVAAPPNDQDARDLIRTELDRNLVVEAAAGTGKTTSLVDRLVSLIAEGVAEPARIAAITFTKKAAGELRERFQNGLEARARSETDPARAENVREALAHLDQCYLGTIHSFCGRMLRERPVEAGVAPDFVEVEQIEADAINGEVWTAYVQGQYLEGSEVLSELEETDLNINDLRTLMLHLCDEADLEFARERRERPDLAEAWSELIRVTRDLDGRIPEAPHEKGRDDVQNLLLKTSAIRRVAEPGDLEIVRLLKDFESSSRDGKVKNSCWPDEDADEIKRMVRELCENVVAPALTAWREYCHPIALELVIPAIRHARKIRIDSGQLSFQDLLTLARDLLRDHAHVRRWFQDRYRFVLVDEFQDTDPVQAEILFYLTGEGGGTSWRELKPRPGSLFIVGDPKQSIYRFRRADIALYKEVKELIVEGGGRVVRLSRNFRSTKALCGWANETFRAILPETETPQQAAMVEVEAHRTDEGAFEGVFSLQLPYSKSSYGYARTEASLIAAWIRDAIESGRTIVESGHERALHWGDFMLLTRTRWRLSIYAEALERARIPYEITGGRGFSASDEIRALAAFMRAVIDPDDQVSLVAFLRGPLAGVSDDELWRHRSADGRWSFLAEAPERTPAPISRAFEQLRTSRHEALELPPASVIGRAIERFGLGAWCLALEGGQTRSGNLYKAMTIARRMSGRGASLTAIVEELTRLTDEPNDLEELSLRAANENVVRVMNLHQAKGLEAPVVFLVDPYDQNDRDPSVHVDRSGEPPVAHVTVTKPKKFDVEVLAQPPDWEEKANRESEFTSAEEARLLYVAATRARQALVVSTAFTKKSGAKGPWSSLWRTDCPELPEVQPRDREREERALDLDVRRTVEGIERALESIRRPSWTVRTASDHSGPAPTMAKGGRGASWGRVLHRVLEIVMKNADVSVEPLVANLLREEGRSGSELPEVVAWVERVKETGLWRRAREAEIVHVEIPFAVNSEDGDEGGDVLLRGVADLVFREKGRWVIVDYKSDATADRLHELIRHYSGQVESYARIWHDLTGEPTSAHLLFLDGSHEIEVTTFR